MRQRSKKVRAGIVGALALGGALSACNAGEEGSLGGQDEAIEYAECSGYDAMPAAQQALWRARCVEDLITKTGSTQQLVDGIPPQPDLKTQYTHGSMLSETDYPKALLTHVNGGAMFPGAILYGQDGVMGVMDAPLFQTQNTGGPVVVSGVTFAEGADSQRKAEQYSKGVVQNTIAQILAEGEAKFAPNVYMTLSETVEAKSTITTGKLAIAAVLKILDIAFDANLNIQKSQSTTDLFAQFLEDYYTVSVPQPNAAASAGFFTPDLTPGNLKDKGISAFNPLGYVSRVNYGRELYVRFRSHHESKDVKAALSIALDIVGDLNQANKNNGSGADGGTADGGVAEDPKHLLELSLSTQTKKTLEETEVIAWGIGGTGAINGLTALSFIQNMLLADPTDPTAPLTPTSYVVNHFQNNKQLKTSRVTDFYRVVSNVKRTQQIEFNSQVNFLKSGDTVGRGDLTGSIVLNGPAGAERSASWKRQTVSDGGSLGLGPVTIVANLDQNPSYSFSFDFIDEDRNWLGKWKNGEHIGGSTPSLSFNGSRWTGNIYQPVVAMNGLLVGRMSAGARAVDGCGTGKGWNQWTCVPKDFTIDNIQAPYAEVCGANPISVHTERVFLTSSHFANSGEAYTVNIQRMAGAYPNLTVDATDPALVETTGIDEQKVYLPANTFTLQQLFSAKNRLLTAGAIYKVGISGNANLGSFGERYVKVKPVGVRSTIDSRQDDNMLVPADAPLIVDVIDACGSGPYYRLDLARWRNGAWQTVVPSHELSRTAVTGMSLRALASQYNQEILPGTSWRLGISVLGIDGTTWQRTEKVIELQECSAGTAWVGDDCYTVSPTWIRSRATGECAFPESVGTGVSYMEPDTCNFAFDFQVVDFGDDYVGVRTPDNRCAERVDFSKGPVHLRPCTGSSMQTFAQHAGPGFVRLEDDENSCLTFRDYVSRDSCEASNLSNRLQFVWTPEAAPHTINVAMEASVAAQSTYPGYSAAKAVDGNRSTALGGATSWSNSRSGTAGNLPNWFDLTWDSARIINRVDLYTTLGYELRDYDIQVWQDDAFVTVASVRGNVGAMKSSTFPEVSTTRLRILTLSGPQVQTVHARINELEVY
jgi:hypothetical protein